MRATWRPLAIWPYQPRPKRQSLFKVGWAETLRDLDREVEAASGTELVIGVVMDDSWLRIDGQPKADFKVKHPGAEVSFDRPGLGRVAFHTDTYDKVQHNLRAITLGLEALRAVDRQGIDVGPRAVRGIPAADRRRAGSGARQAPRRPARLGSQGPQGDPPRPHGGQGARVRQRHGVPGPGADVNPMHAHRPPGDDMVRWDPGEAPPFTGLELLQALPLGCLGFVAVGALIALAFILLGVSPEAHPGWW